VSRLVRAVDEVREGDVSSSDILVSRGEMYLDRRERVMYCLRMLR
jgi:hypothetical protein